jgi:hypothetical protein
MQPWKVFFSQPCSILTQKTAQIKIVETFFYIVKLFFDMWKCGRERAGETKKKVLIHINILYEYKNNSFSVNFYLDLKFLLMWK